MIRAAAMLVAWALLVQAMGWSWPARADDSPFPSLTLVPIEAPRQWANVKDHSAPFAVTTTNPEAVNIAVNHTVRYAAEPAGTDDWQAPGRTWETKSGDCEDFAILKYALLRAAGVPEDRLMVVTGIIRGTIPQPHAVLMVREEGGGWLVLDNRFDRPVRPADYVNFSPVKAFSGPRAYLFGRPFRINGEPS